MICKECADNGMFCNVYETCDGMVSSRGAAEYCDANGNKHYHNPNRCLAVYKCSNGHKWTGTLRYRCPSCDFWSADENA